MTDITLEQRARQVIADWHREKGCSQQVIEDCLSGNITIPEFYMELLEAALRLSAGADSARLDALEALVDSQPDKALLLHHGIHIIRDGERRYSGLGLSNTRRTLREAIDQAALRPSAGEGKGISASHKKHDGPCWRNSHADCGC